MSVKSKMTAIADKIRALLGISGTMGLDAMAANLATEQTNVTNAFTAVGGKGGTVPTSKVSGNLVTAINSIPSGVTVQKKTGTFTTSTSGAATVNCGFKPDVVAFDTGDGSYARVFPAVDFNAAGLSSISICHNSSDYNNYVVGVSVVNQTSTGFSITMRNLSYSMATSYISRKTYNYVAIKYTE